MLDENQEVEVGLDGRGINYYKALGYNIPQVKNKWGRLGTPMGTKIIVKVKDLMKGSHAEVKYTCDFCGKPLTCEYKTYNQMKKDSHSSLDSCNDCKFIKIRQTNLELYGVEHILSIPEVRQKSYDLNRHDYEFIKQEFDTIGYDLITIDYENNTQPLDYICRKHKDYGIQTTNYANIQDHGSACRPCANERLREIQLNDFESVLDEYKKLGYIPMFRKEDYIDCHTPLKCSCQKHPKEVFNVSLVHARRGQGCEKCFEEKISGENHWNWKGGISSLSNYLRDKIKYWVLDSLKSNNFKCLITNIEDHNLVVHHTYSFYKIMQEILESTNIPLYQQVSLYSKEQLKTLEDKCLEIHNRIGLGKPIIKPLHILFHSQTGTPEIDNGEFEEFCGKYKNFEFDHLLEDEYKWKNIINKAS